MPETETLTLTIPAQSKKGKVSPVIKTMLGTKGALLGLFLGLVLGGLIGAFHYLIADASIDIIFKKMLCYSWFGGGAGMAAGAIWERGLISWMPPNKKPEFHAYWQDRLIYSTNSTQTLLLGIILPSLCLIFDPIVFRPSKLSYVLNLPAILPSFQMFAISAAGIGVLFLLAWIVIGQKFGLWTCFIAGNLLAAAVVSFAVGFAILPLTVVFSLLLVGALGFLPFFTAATFFVNGIRAFRSRAGELTRSSRLIVLAIGLILFFIIPAMAQRHVTAKTSRAFENILNENPRLSENAIQTLKAHRWCANQFIIEIVHTHNRETDPQRRKQLADVYQKITSQHIPVMGALGTD